VRTCCQRYLISSRIRRLLACEHWPFTRVCWRCGRGVFVEERFSEAKVRTKLPQEWLAIAEMGGAALWKKIPNVHDYFRLTSDQQAARHQARMEALKFSHKSGRKAEKLAQENRNKRRRERYAELKRAQTELPEERKEAA